MTENIDYGLKFYREVFKLDSLHFGYWDTPAELTLENLRKAQDRYIENLLSFIPSNVKKILDVGCGIGSVARQLKKKGFDVESITPDEYQAEIFSQVNPDIRLYITKFENFQTDKKYDLILFSESFQYLDIEKSLEKSCKLLEENGYILISDYFRKTETPYYKTCHIESDFLSSLKKHPLATLEVQDITEKTTPTLLVGSKIYNEYAVPILEIITGYLNTKFKILTKLLSIIFYFHIKKIRNYIYERMNDKLNPEKFKKLMTYKVYLLKKI